MSDIKKFIRNGLVVFDYLTQKIRQGYYSSNMGIGGVPVFGRIKEYNEENFKFEASYLKQSKINELSIPLIIKMKDCKPSELGSKVQSMLIQEMLGSAPDAMVFGSLSSLGMQRDLKLPDELQRVYDKLIYASRNTSGVPLETFTPEEKEIMLILGEENLVRNISVLTVVTKDYAMSTFLESRHTKNGPKATDKDLFFDKLNVLDRRKSDGKVISYDVKEVYEGAPYFLVDLDW